MHISTYMRTNMYILYVYICVYYSNIYVVYVYVYIICYICILYIIYKLVSILLYITQLRPAFNAMNKPLSFTFLHNQLIQLLEE